MSLTNSAICSSHITILQLHPHQLTIQPIIGWIRCMEIAEDHGPSMFSSSLPFTILLFLFGAIISPFLLKNLRGHQKWYMILYQLSIIIYVTLSLVSQIVWVHLVNEFFKRFVIVLVEEYWTFIVISCNIIIKQLFYYLYHVFTILQCAHYHCMICDPLNFKEFSASKNVVRRIVIALALSPILLIDDITKVTFTYQHYQDFPDEDEAESLVGNIIYYSLAELCVFKLLYISALAKICYDIRNSLSEAENVRRDVASRRPLFYIMALIPLINGILCSATDITLAAISVYLNSHLESLLVCGGVHNVFTNVVEIPLAASVYSLTFFINTCGYLICFPKLRLCCRES